jgi:integrase
MRAGEREAISSWHLNRFDPGDKRKDFYDPPLCYRANSKGKGSFVFRYYVDGKRRRVTLGKHPGMTLNEARAAAFALQAQVSKGGDPASAAVEMREAKSERSFGKFVKAYLDRRADQLRTGDEVRRVFKVSVLPHFGPRCVDDISRTEIAEFLDGVAATRPVMANRMLAHIRAMFNWLSKRGLIDKNPAAGLAMPGGRERPRDRVLTEQEIRAIWSAPENTFKALVQIALLTAQRRASIAGMKWEDLKLDGPTPLWRIPAVDMKMDRPHDVSLSSQAVAIISSLQRTGPFVFGKDGAAPYSGFSKSRERLQRATGTKGWTLHDCRRTATTLMAPKTTAEVMRAILDHKPSSNDMLGRVYNQHSYHEEARTAVNVLGQKIDEIAAERYE